MEQSDPHALRLSWLPAHSNWDNTLAEVRKLPTDEAARRSLQLCGYSLDFMQTARLDKALQKLSAEVRTHLTRSPPIRLALIGSSTMAHLSSGIRVAAARWGMWVEVYEGEYGSYHRELIDLSSGLHRFSPDVVLISLDAHHVDAMERHQTGHTLERLKDCWRLAKESFGATIIQQTILPVMQPLMGNNEHGHAQSPGSSIRRINNELRTVAASEHIALLSVDSFAQEHGTNLWFDAALWHRFKQEVHPQVSHHYGEQVARLLAASRGLSYKCLVLDLDNTLWGGIIGDDGIDGIQLGHGHAAGEAFASFQSYVKALGDRGVILAVCSKNDEKNALIPFERHTEMVLRREDIACFVANWQDKATNIRSIATRLNIGLDSIVFVDDNPFERNLVRQELPMVAVPELPDEPALYARALAAGGYFEAIELTPEDLERNQLYLANARREVVKTASTGMGDYLLSLNMQLHWSEFTGDSLTRVAQLINRSNQFNLTTRRYTYEDVRSLADNASVLTLQLRLVDAYGDNGLIGVVIGRRAERSAMTIDTWLMSCRVLGRQVEESTLNLIAARASELGIEELLGVFIPTAKNEMVRDHYARLGFERVTPVDQEVSVWRLGLSNYTPRNTSVWVAPALTSFPGEAYDARTNLQ